MARHYCGLRNLLICVCTPFCCLLLLFTYAAITISLSLNRVSSLPRVLVTYNPRSVLPESRKNVSLPVVPTTFWEHQSSAYWNQLQRGVDRHFNPILNTKSRNRSVTVHLDDSLLRKSFFEANQDGSHEEET
ncbi:hypothetical protein FQA47_001552 [Oryzias melastigma]|uniref:Uncharacterized protein n=1 Tax=Oryzias melastigma TaxID=30732 RepID=A0A834L2P9_ORYME|nr:hypothetical protein FQA47_001552 [Oryzias melastigma]